MANLIGQHLGQYEIVGLLGEGGMAAVYRAHQESMKRDVAIKVIKTGLVDMTEFVGRFEREAQMSAALSHAHILKVFDYGQSGDLVYLVMELLTGGSLATLIQRNEMPLKQVSRVLDQVASALDYAHQKGVIHRDLKPENVLLDEAGNVFLSDFGLARLMTAPSGLTQSGYVVGTPNYMSPEQWQSRPLDARVDVYALGVILFEMLGRKLPFDGDGVLSIMYMHLHEAPPSILALRPDLPPAVQDVINRALEKDPARRFQSAGQLAAAFRAALAGKKLPAVPVSTQPGPTRSPAATVLLPAQTQHTTRRWIGLGVLLMALAAVLLVILLASGVFDPGPPIPTAARIAFQVTTPAPTLNLETAVAMTLTQHTVLTANAVASFTKTPTLTATATELAPPTPTNTRPPTLTPFPTATSLPVATIPLVIQPTKPGGFVTLPPITRNGSGTPSKQAMRVLTTHTADVRDVALSPNSQLAVTASADKTARLFYVQSGKLLRTFVGHSGAVNAVAFSPDSKYVVTGGDDDTAILWSIDSDNPVRRFVGHTDAVTVVTFSPDGQSVITASADDTIRYWEVSTGKNARTLTARGVGVSALAISPDGRKLAFGGSDRNVYLWDVGSPPKSIRYLGGHTNAITSLTFSPDSRFLASGGKDNTARLWDVSSGSQIRSFIGHTGEVTALAFYPGGQVLFSSSKDGTMRAWDVRTGAVLHIFSGHSGPVLTIACASSSQFLLTGGGDNTARLWLI